MHKGVFHFQFKRLIGLFTSLCKGLGLICAFESAGQCCVSTTRPSYWRNIEHMSGFSAKTNRGAKCKIADVRKLIGGRLIGL